MRTSVWVVILLGAMSAAWGQESRATIVGRVVDPSGALVAGAKVQAINTAQNAPISTTVNDQGYYEISYLITGIYRVEVEMQGFKKAVREGIELHVNDRIALDFTLELGNLSESVVVTGEASQLESTSASIGLIMDERRVVEFPVVGGNPFYLSRLTPGVLSSSGRQAGNPMDQGAATEVIAVGTRSGSSEAMVDGSPNMYNRTAVFSPPQDLVAEFRIHTTTYDATIGHAAGAMTNVSMKSGGNSLHGTGYFNDSHWRAVPWFTNRYLYDPNTGPMTKEKFDLNVPTWLHQRWGATLTGPVVLPKIYNGRNKTFWTFGYEGLKIIRNLSFTGTVPAAEQKRGDFSSLLRLGSTYQIYDPFTTTASGTRFLRQPLPGNIVPASRIDPVAANLLKYYPDANQPGTSDGRNNYFRTRSIDRFNRTLTSRVDHNFSEKNRFFLRWNNNQHDNEQDALPGIVSGTILDRTGWGAVADEVYVINSQFLLNVRYGITTNQNYTKRRSQGFDLASLGFSPALLNEINNKNSPAGIAFPNIVIDGSAYTDVGDNGGNTLTSNYQTGSATATRIAGNHSLRFGTEFRLQRETNYAYGNVAPRLVFNQLYTHGPADTDPSAPIGQGLASMLLGVPTDGRININASYAQQSTYTSLFLQDDWRISPNLTFNMGVRYEYEGPTTERYNRSVRDFDYDVASPISAAALANYAKSPIPELPVSQFKTLGGLRFAGVNGQPRGLWKGDRNNFAPRAGLAYQLGNSTVLRAGYGVFFDVLGVDRTDVNQNGFSQPTNVIPSLDNGLTYRVKLSNPFPDGLQLPFGASQGIATYLGRAITFYNAKPLNPYMQRWSFSMQNQLPWRTRLETAYVGNRGNKLASTHELNPTPREFLSTSPVRDQNTITLLNTQVNNPFYGIPEFAGSDRSAQRIQRGDLLRPRSQFGSIQLVKQTGFSWYHALLVSAEKRMSSGLTFQASWTWSKFMEATGFLNETDPIQERVISDNDYPHRFTFNAIWEVPVGRGRRLLSNAGGLADAVIGGWQFQGWYEGQSGDVMSWGNVIFFGNLKDITVPVSQRSAERWFNVDAGFERSSARALGRNIRTFPSRFNDIRSDGINNFDLSMFKNFRIKERTTLQFRLETFNTLNHVQFDAPNLNPANSAFGTISAEKGHGQRQLTLGLKLLF